MKTLIAAIACFVFFGCNDSVNNSTNGKDSGVIREAEKEVDSSSNSANTKSRNDSTAIKNGHSLIFDKYGIEQNDCRTLNDYEAKLKKQGVLGVKDDMHDFGKEFIVELYDSINGNFLGFQGDTTKFNWRKIEGLHLSNREKGLISKYPIEDVKAILKHKVSPDMTEDEAIESWGKPDKINKTTTANGVSEQWVYGDSYLYFENGKLTSIQN